MDKSEIELDGVTYKAAEPLERPYCFGCVFYDLSAPSGSCDDANSVQRCVPPGREDGRHIIWVLA